MNKFVLYYGFCLICSTYYNIMAKKKIDCPECCTHTISITAENCNVLWDEQARLKKQRNAHTTIERIVNKIIMEWKVDRDVENAIKNNSK